MAELDRARIRIACDVDGHAGDWIEFDASQWGLAEFDLLMGTYKLHDGLGFVKRDSTAWHITGSNGTVSHPGRGASSFKWSAAFRAIGPEGLYLSRWLSEAPGNAMLEALRLDRKSSSGNNASDLPEEAAASGITDIVDGADVGS